MGFLLRVLKAAVSGILPNDALSRGASIAFYAATSLAPVLLIVVAIAGLAFGQDAARAAISAELGRLLGPSGGEFIKSILERSSDPTSGATATLVGVVTVLVTASGVFGEMRTALNTTFKAKPSDEPIFSLIRSRAASLGLVAALGFLLIVSLAASAGLSALEHWSAGRVVQSALNTVVSLGIFTLLFAAIYRVLPDTSIYWRHLVLGAFVTAVLFTVGKSLIGWYLGRAAPSSAYGAAGALIVLMFWVYYSAQIFLFGAELTKAIDDERSPADARGTIEHRVSSLSHMNTKSQGGNDMTRSVEELRRDSKVSPDGIKAEVSGFISQKTDGWLDALKQQAMDNPMQAIAAGTAIAVPVLRLARGFPLPLLMIGAGLALSSKTVRDRAAEAAAPGVEKAREVMGETTARVQSLGDGVRRAISDAERQAAGMASEAQDTTSRIADAAGETASDLKDRAAQTVDAVTSKFSAGMDAASEKAKQTIERARSTANDAPAAASKLIRDNAALIGGLGVAIGAILAASLPTTRAETGVMGKASDRVKRAAGTATQSGFEAAKDTVLSAADAAAKSVADADLGKHVSRITEDVTERLKEVADDVVTTAFDPSRNPHS